MMRRTCVVAVLAALLLAGQACLAQQAAEQTVIGPYVQQVTQNSARICWATASGALTLAAPNQPPRDLRSYAHHEILLDNLLPGTTYAYNLPGFPDAKGTVTTLPAADEPFTFAIIGDTRSGHEQHQKLVNMMIAQKPVLVVNTGDIVRDGYHMEDWEMFFKINRELMRSTPYYPVLGNHERDAPAYYEFFSLPGHERYYSLDRGGVHMAFLDPIGPRLRDVDTSREPARSEQARLSEQFRQEQLAWLKADLAAHQDAAFRLVFMHVGPWTLKQSRLEGAAMVRQWLGSTLDDNHVQAVIYGHDHYYGRLENKGIMYVTCGGGGAGLYDPDAQLTEVDKVFTRNKVYSYMVARVEKGAIKFTAFDVDGKEIDAFALSASPATPGEAKP